MDAALLTLDQFVQRRIRDAAPFRALIDSHSNGMATLQMLDDDTAGTELYARLPGFVNGRVGDEVMCLMVNGKPFILGVVQRAAGTPFYGMGSAAGSGATAQFLGADDISGVIEVVGGTGAFAGSIIGVNFGVPKASGTYDVVLTPQTTATASLGGNWNVTSQTSTKFDIRVGVALTNGSIYRWSYLVREHTAT